ncbi:MAG TPA: hypothetical protein VGQ06_02075, partial [Gemmatimonadales bacterium]|nr:hypothetical protein [Gemmatimonadales bacterium]
FAAAALGVVLGAAACHNDELFRPANFTPIDPLFERYVSMGNSITAGFQSDGINDSTQLQSYPVLLASRMGSPFFMPLMNRPGCRPPFTNVFTQARVGGGTPATCALRKPQNPPPPYISNTAVPGAEVLDIYSNVDTASNANPLTTFILGGLTQAQMMARAQPTFVSVWIGNNDVLGAATDSANGGDSTKITSIANFQARSTALFDSIAAVGPRGVIVIGVANVTLIPFFSRGAIYWAIDNGLVPGAAFPPAFVVDAGCRPNALGGTGDSVLVPFRFGAFKLGRAQAGLADTLYCTDVHTVQPAELRKLVTTVAAYNTFDSTQATTRGWAWLNPNVTLATLAADTAQVRPFPYFPQGNAGDTVAVRRPFGRAFSLDAVHPSASAHKLIANALRTAINTKYGTAIPQIF